MIFERFRRRPDAARSIASTRGAEAMAMLGTALKHARSMLPHVVDLSVVLGADTNYPETIDAEWFAEHARHRGFVPIIDYGEIIG